MVRLLLAVAVVVGIPAWAYHTQAADLSDSALEDFSHDGADRDRFFDAFKKADSLYKKGVPFQEVTVYTFLAVTALLPVQTVILLSRERDELGGSPLQPSMRHRRPNASPRTAFDE